jgi:tRNA-Thr(GGU) m(6)t(6)A37 methyltransferase TsaA
MEYRLSQIAHIRTDFKEKFGVPRQAGVVPGLKGKIVFEPEFRNADMLKGLEEFSHLWLIWEFSKNLDEDGNSRWTPTVRPPRLGGNERKGVFATRSPFRPNPLGLSVVKIEKITEEPGLGPVIYVLGADMVDGTPIFDIKPYIPYADAVLGAKGGFTDSTEYKTLNVVWEKKDDMLPEEERLSLEKILANDPRPHYQNDPQRIYGMSFAGYEVKFRVSGDTVSVVDVIK